VSGLNVLDIIFIAVLLFSALFGVFRGFIKEVLSLIFLILSLLLGIVFYSDAGRLFQSFFKSKQLSNIAGFIAVSSLVLITGYILTYFTRKVLRIGPIKSIDRLLGGVFGVIRGILISAVILFAIVYLPLKKDIIIGSKLSPYLYDIVKIIKGYLPENLEDLLKGI